MLTVSTHFSLTDDLNAFLRMLKSVSFADEILIFVYRGVSDKVIAQLKKNPLVKIKLIPPVPLVEHIRASQVREAKGDWVLLLDFDELVSQSLKTSILEVINNPKSSKSTFYLQRRNYSLGYPLRYGGWEDDKILRLLKKVDFLDWPKSIHSTPTFCGDTGELSGVLEHHKDATLSYMVRKTNLYSEAEAQLFFAGKMAQVTNLTLFRKPILEFIRRYLLKLGFLDGKIGLIQALYQSYSVFLTYAKLYELQHKKRVN